MTSHFAAMILPDGLELRLRELERDDIPQINRWRNDPGLISTLGAGYRFIAEEVDQIWFDNYLRHRDSNIRLAIVAGGQHVGNVQLTGIHPVNRSAEFSILIGEPAVRGRGVGLWATTAILRHGFAHQNLHRIHLTVLEDNAAALAIYRKAGFRQEGLLRDAVFKNGAYKNLIAMAVLAGELR